MDHEELDNQLIRMQSWCLENIEKTERGYILHDELKSIFGLPKQKSALWCRLLKWIWDTYQTKSSRTPNTAYRDKLHNKYYLARLTFVGLPPAGQELWETKRKAFLLQAKEGRKLGQANRQRDAKGRLLPKPKGEG